jgi:hypothetical protein
LVTLLRFRRVRNSQTRLRADVCKLICCENHRCTQRRRIGPRKSPSRLESHGPRSNQEPRSSLIQLRLPGQIRGTCGLEDGGSLRSPGASIHLGIIRLRNPGEQVGDWAQHGGGWASIFVRQGPPVSLPAPGPCLPGRFLFPLPLEGAPPDRLPLRSSGPEVLAELGRFVDPPGGLLLLHCRSIAPEGALLEIFTILTTAPTR